MVICPVRFDLTCRWIVFLIFLVFLAKRLVVRKLFWRLVNNNFYVKAADVVELANFVERKADGVQLLDSGHFSFR